MKKKQWRCFFCDDVFTTLAGARDHFGSDEGCYSDGPACKLNEKENGLLGLYREALAEIRRHQNEDTPSHRVFYALGAAHQTAMRRAEEAGYARGLADVRAPILRALREWPPSAEVQLFLEAAGFGSPP